MWTDNETADDLLGFRVHADLIRAVITDPDMLPTTIGLFGDWGGGKTSIMRMLEHDLEPENWAKGSDGRGKCENTAVLYFNTWMFEGYDDSKAAILSSVLIQLGDHKRFGPKLRDKVVSLLKTVNLMRLARLALTRVAVPAVAGFFTGGAAAAPLAVAASAGLASVATHAGSDESAGTKIGEKVDWATLINTDASPAGTLDVRTFRARFEQMLKDSNITSLVVLIDDLDRCMPERIIDNLEAIKLFLSVPGTAFVIGADPRIVEHAIRLRYAERALDGVPDREDSDRLVKDYLEKIVQIPYHLPRLSAAEIESYMVLLFCKRYLIADDSAACVRACETERSRNRYSTFGYAGVKEALSNKELRGELAEALAFCGSAAPLIADGLKGNPRQVKRFLNALLLRKQLAKVAKLDNIRDDVLVKLMILEYTNDKLFAELFEWQSQQEGHPQQLAALEVAATQPRERDGDVDAVKQVDAKWSVARTRKWLAMDPRLSSVDLRDYFWIARDKLASTFAGLSMVPPVVRKVLDDLLSGSAVKRKAALAGAQSLREEEKSMLLNLIDQHVARQPERKEGYDALRHLVENRVPGAAQALANILLTKAPEKMPPAVGMDVMTLVKAKPEFAAILQPAIERLQGTTARIGVAAQSAKKR